MNMFREYYQDDSHMLHLKRLLPPCFLLLLCILYEKIKTDCANVAPAVHYFSSSTIHDI